MTSSELTILGLLIESPNHGYGLEQVIERRGIREWTELGFSSIYYLLSRLEKRGLVTATPGKTPKARRVFSPTDAGRDAVREATMAALTDTRPAFPPFLVAIAHRSLVSDEELAKAINQRLAAVEERIKTVRSARSAQRPLPPAAEAVFSYSLSLLEAERNWLADGHATNGNKNRFQEDTRLLPGQQSRVQDR
ncbi:MAG: PadR family transcriptional regulator [Labedaea sp.]